MELRFLGGATVIASSLLIGEPARPLLTGSSWSVRDSAQEPVEEPEGKQRQFLQRGARGRRRAKGGGVGLFDGFSLDEGEVRRDELQVACLDRKQKAFGVFSHAGLGVLFVTRRRVVFLDRDEKPLFETELGRLAAASVSPGTFSSPVPLLVLRYRDPGGREDSVRFRLATEARHGDEALLRAWIERVARLMREEHLELECP